MDDELVRGGGSINRMFSKMAGRDGRARFDAPDLCRAVRRRTEVGCDSALNTSSVSIILQSLCY